MAGYTPSAVLQRIAGGRPWRHGATLAFSTVQSRSEDIVGAFQRLEWERGNECTPNKLTMVTRSGAAPATASWDA